MIHQLSKDKSNTIIFIHGGVGNHTTFKHTYHSLSSSYRVISYDLYGHGAEKNVSRDMSIFDLVHQLLLIYKKEGIEQAHLCSLSLGTYVANAFAYFYPDKVSSICLVGGFYNNPSPLFQSFQDVWDNRHMKFDKWTEYFASKIFPLEFGGSELMEESRGIFIKHATQMQPQTLYSVIRIHIETDMKTMISSINQIPFLWIMGQYDHLFKSCLFDLFQVHNNTEYREILNAGHVAHINNPGVFLQMYLAFLIRNESNERRILVEC